MKNKNGKVTVGILIGVIVVLLGVIVALLIFRKNEEKTNTVSKENYSETIKNIVSNEYQELAKNNIESIISNEYQELSKNDIENVNVIQDKNSNENNNNKENIVLYYGYDISKEDLEMSIPYTDANKNKYEIKYYNYENGKFVNEGVGKLSETYEGYSCVDNTSKIAMSKKYDAIPRKYSVINELPEQLMEMADCNKVEINSIDLDGDNKLEYVVAWQTFSSPETHDTDKYSNYSEIKVLDSSFKTIATLVSAENQYWENNGKVTDEFFCSLDDVEYIDIDNDGIMEILVNTHVYEGIGVNIYKYKNNKISGKVNYELSVLP